MRNFHDNSQIASYLTGGASIAIAGLSSAGARAISGALDDAAPPPNYANFGGDTFDDGLAGAASQLPDLPISSAAATARETAAVAESFDTLATALGERAAIQVPQRAVGLGIDGLATDTNDLPE